MRSSVEQRLQKLERAFGTEACGCRGGPRIVNLTGTRLEDGDGDWYRCAPCEAKPRKLVRLVNLTGVTIGGGNDDDQNHHAPTPARRSS